MYLPSTKVHLIRLQMVRLKWILGEAKLAEKLIYQVTNEDTLLLVFTVYLLKMQSTLNLTHLWPFLRVDLYKQKVIFCQSVVLPV